MPQPAKGPRLGGGPAHEKLLLANLARALFTHGRITTTEAKARRLRPVAERLITKAKKGDLHNRRQVLQTITDKSVVHTLFTEIGPRYANRPGGYTRITKIGPRRGDNAPMAVIELVEALTVQQDAVGEAEAATRRSAKDRAGDRALAETGDATKGAREGATKGATEDATKEAEAAKAAEEEAESEVVEDTAEAAEDGRAEATAETAEGAEAAESKDA